MAGHRPIRLPKQWSQHVKAGVLHAVSPASVVLTFARNRTVGHRRVQLELARTEIALLREELSIKDGRWERSRSRRRLDEQGDHVLIRTVEPVNRYPDFARNLVRQLKRLFPEMSSERMAQFLARAGLCLGATTIRRIMREKEPPPEDILEETARRRRRVVARYPGHTLHVDLTTVPTRAGFWVPWFPFSLPQRWSFCWWIAVAVDQVSRALLGFAVFSQPPSSNQVQRFLDRAIRASGSGPRYVITDKGSQFWCRSFKGWCKRRGIQPRYGAVGEPASIAIVERFILSMKEEAMRLILVPLSLDAMLREIGLYAIWFNTHRPHMALNGNTPREIFKDRTRKRRQIEPRPRWPRKGGRRSFGGDKVWLKVSYVNGRKHLPVIELRRAA